MSKSIGLSPELGKAHVSKDRERGQVEYDPILRLPDGTILRGEHGLTDVRAEIVRAAYDSGGWESPIIKDILKD